MSEFGYPMPRYFQNMPKIGNPAGTADSENEAELKKVGGGRTSSDDEDEYGHDVWCWIGWHCYTVTLHTQTESKRASCWSNYDCIRVNIK